MPFQAVLFDMDGTLLDTLEDIAHAMNHALSEHRLPTHPVSAYRHFVGSGAPELAARALPPDAPHGLRRQVLEAFLTRYRQAWNIHTRLYAGIPELLDFLCAQGLAMAVLTNKPQEFAEQCMHAYLASWPFAVMRGMDAHTPPKPHPAGPRRIMEHLGIAAEGFLYLGDTDVDMLTARAVGMHAVGVTWGFRPEAELRAAGAQTIIHHPMELAALLESPIKPAPDNSPIPRG
ncbi:MAG: HAD-superfamily hydrolase, subfamily variant 1 [Desulfomicrobiaceae bacterium]|jgi:phosphoglycolate phosphatase|nr:HAD-superfamily hydrolase, subfamily variant 1 [Desulfomicrobiaceae bacterium]